MCSKHGVKTFTMSTPNDLLKSGTASYSFKCLFTVGIYSLKLINFACTCDREKHLKNNSADTHVPVNTQNFRLNFCCKCRKISHHKLTSACWCKVEGLILRFAFVCCKTSYVTPESRDCATSVVNLLHCVMSRLIAASVFCYQSLERFTTLHFDSLSLLAIPVLNSVQS